MKQRIFGIYDRVAGTYLGAGQALIVAPAEPVVVRLFGDLAAEAQGVVGRHPEDHEVHMLGVLDLQTGEIVPEKEVVLTGSAWLSIQLAARSKEGDNGR